MGDYSWQDVYFETEPSKRKEVASPDWVFETRPNQTATPETELEALMMAGPGDVVAEVPAANPDTYQNLDKILGTNLELDDVEKEVLDAVFVAGLSIREAASVLDMPQTTVWRIKESALDRIRRRINGQGS
jgi:DNA-directed RNA polymerase specialized sigma24 family protein